MAMRFLLPVATTLCYETNAVVCGGCLWRVGKAPAPRTAPGFLGWAEAPRQCAMGKICGEVGPLLPPFPPIPISDCFAPGGGDYIAYQEFTTACFCSSSC